MKRSALDQLVLSPCSMNPRHIRIQTDHIARYELLASVLQSANCPAMAAPHPKFRDSGFLWLCDSTRRQAPTSGFPLCYSTRQQAPTITLSERVYKHCRLLE